MTHAAAPLASNVIIQDTQQYLTLVSGGDSFAIGILAIREIMEFGNITQVPQMPDFVRGVINLRGAVVPVIDLGARMGRGITPTTRRTCIIIAETGHAGMTQVIGLLVDSVSEVLEIEAGEIEQAPAFGAGLRTDFIAGMGKVKGRFVIILDMNRVLSVEDMTAPA